MLHRSSLAIAATLLTVSGCGTSSDTTPQQGPPGVDASVDATSDAYVDTSPDTIMFDTSLPDSHPLDGFAPCGDAGCATGTHCKYGVCVPLLGTCTTHDNCPGDSYCDAEGVCVPYGVPPEVTHDPACKQTKPSPGVAPTVQCEWVKPPDGDPTAAYNLVYTTPVVADLNLDGDPGKLQPSIVISTFTSDNARTGMLRVFDGRTCEEQLRLGGPDDPDVSENRPGYGTQWAIADLDQDVSTPTGHPEIIGTHRVGLSGGSDPLTLVAFGVEGTGPGAKLVRRWHGRICDPGGHDQPVTFANNGYVFGPGVWDLDDNGSPEIVIDTLVFDAKGCLLNPPAKVEDYLQLGQFAVVADVDLDSKPDLVRANGVFDWNLGSKQWELKSYFTGTGESIKSGYVALADMGEFSSLPGHPASDPLPEVIVVSAAVGTQYSPASTGSVRVMTLTGQIVFGPFPLPHKDASAGTGSYGGHGGPPTAGDFDGDGYPEFAAAGNAFYAVFDPDCIAVRKRSGKPDGTCNRTADSIPTTLVSDHTGILWGRGSQDYSSSVTGSSVFDFDGDGAAEAVYRDECYLRVYRGKTGEVIYSSPATSGTGDELPVIADVDGDFATEVVVARAGAVGCPSPDPLFPGSGELKSSTGFVVLRDPEDRWVPSRPIWNQHAYSVTHITDDGRVPRSSEVLRNWEQPGLNSFRQNTPGSLGAIALADLTVELVNLEGICAGQEGELSLSAEVCNRGTNPVQDGAMVRFSRVDVVDGSVSDAGGALLCETSTPKLLSPGECVTVSCVGSITSDMNLAVSVDPEGQIPDCHPGNNDGASSVVMCPTIK